jgi:ATP-dependent Clp protease protease subunit
MKIEPFAFVPVVRQSQRPPEAVEALRAAGITDVTVENRLEVRAQADAHEIVLTGAVGRSWWDDSGITEAEFREALKGIPEGRQIRLLINSEGGSVKEGLGIYNAIKARSKDITARISGYALSIASVFPLAASKVISPKAAIWMVHKAWSYAQGNSDDMENSAKMLREHDEVLSDIYAAETGKDKSEWLDLMKAETWIRGASAVEYGLADETEDDDAVAAYRPLHPDFISRCKNLSPEILNTISAAAKGEQKTKSQTDNAKPITPAAVISDLEKGLVTFETMDSALGYPASEQIRKQLIENAVIHAIQSTPAPKQGAENHNKSNTMRNKLIALLNSRGVEVNDSMTDEQLLALVENGKPKAAAAAPQNSIDITSEIAKGVKAEVAKLERKADAKEALAKLVGEKRITQAQADKALPAIIAFAGEIKDSPVLAALRENPIMQEPAEPVAADSEITGDASVADICNGIKQCNDAMKSWQRGNSVSAKALAKASVRRAEIINQHAKKLHGVLAAGTNTIDAALQRDVILQSVIVDFARRLLPLQAFSTVFQNVPLEGTNKVQVPFFDLDSGSSTSFKGSDGYVAGDTATDNREIQIGKRADSDVADNTKQYDRKYQALSFTSEELARQPYLNVVQLARLKAEKLASDIVSHVLSIVTAANYGAAEVTKAAALFTSDDVADLKLACKAWPEMGRSLILDSAYDAALLKDGAIKGALNYGGSEAIRQGRIPELFGFSYREIPTIPSNSENLVGFATFVSAILFAQAPVPPTEEVRRDGTAYSIITDPATGIAFEYRTFGNSQADKAVHIIEASYGFAKGNGNALKRIVSGNA